MTQFGVILGQLIAASAAQQALPPLADGRYFHPGDPSRSTYVEFVNNKPVKTVLHGDTILDGLEENAPLADHAREAARTSLPNFFTPANEVRQDTGFATSYGTIQDGVYTHPHLPIRAIVRGGKLADIGIQHGGGFIHAAVDHPDLQARFSKIIHEGKAVYQGPEPEVQRDEAGNLADGQYQNVAFPDQYITVRDGVPVGLTSTDDGVTCTKLLSSEQQHAWTTTLRLGVKIGAVNYVGNSLTAAPICTNDN